MMMRISVLFLAVLVGPAVLAGHAFQEPLRASVDYRSKVQQAVQELVQQYREAAPVVQQFMKDLDEKLAQGDFKVAQYYASRGNNVGALSRLKTIIDNYPNFSRIDEVNQLYKKMSIAMGLQEIRR
jgi:outer membrane protein assembly factor BamD (BamD/ComL family)